jgi:hypothetical protein
MKIKTSELTGATLDLAVAIAARYTTSDLDLLFDIKSYDQFNPTRDWAQGGPIIERERISVISDFHEIEEGWLAESYEDSIQQFGPTPLIAALRCYVASKLGDEVEVPEELL